MKNQWQQILGMTQTMLEYGLNNDWTRFNQLNQKRQTLMKTVEVKTADIGEDVLGYIKEINLINRQLLSMATTCHDKNSEELLALRRKNHSVSGY